MRKPRIKFIIILAVIFIAFGVIFSWLHFSYIKEISTFSVVPLKITITEGCDINDIADKFRHFKNFNRENFLKITKNKEGYLFPDTYFFSGQENEVKVAQMMEENFQKKVKEIKPADLIIASILEREARILEDKKIIAGILWKRLKTGMPLQVDATLNYLNGKTSEDMTVEDLNVDSPYNTYLYTGLPPSPICNPGLDSISAALNPQDSPYWYYLSDKQGIIHFAETFDEHKINKAKYLTN